MKTPSLGLRAYVLGDGGQALVLDPRRDVEVYLRLAREAGLTITHVFETHRQEDFVLGATALAGATGAAVVTGDHARFGHGDLRLGDGDEMTLGALRLRALATPGHTPESMSYAVFVPEAPARPWGVFTGDALLAGTTGRTDLVDPGATAEHAARLYDAVHGRLLPLGDSTLVFPAHGAGSVCGGRIADLDATTIGFERGYNPVFTLAREGFVHAKREEQLPRLPSFERVGELNGRGGVPLAIDPGAARVLSAAEFERARARAVVVDTRAPEAFAGGHVPGSVSIWRAGLGHFAAWVLDATTPVVLLLERAEDAPEAVAALARIGVDDVRGILGGGFGAWRAAGLPMERTGTITAGELHARRRDFLLLDVREGGEFARGHVAHARNVYVGHLEARLSDLGLRPDDAIAVTCSVGHRAGLAASLLQRRGFRAVTNVLGGMRAWSALGLPVVQGDR